MFNGKFSIVDLMKNAKKLQEAMQKAQEELEKIQITGEAGGGLVKVVMNGQHAILDLQVEDELRNEPKEVMCDLICAALNDANRKILKLTQEKMLAGQKFYNLDQVSDDDTL